MDIGAKDRKILIVDDAHAAGSLMEKILHAEGYLTRYEDNAKAGLEAALEWAPDVALIDVFMEGMSGIELSEAIRAANLEKRPSIIMVSAHDDKDVIAEALSKGADDYIVKPLDKLELIARVKVQLRANDLCHELEEEKRNLKTILDITSAIGATLDSAEVLDNVVKRVASSMGAVRCSIVLISKENEGYVLASHESEKLRNLKIDLNKYPEIQEVMASKVPLALEDMTDHPIMSTVKEFIKDLQGMSVLVVPIVFNEEVMGTLFLRAQRAAKGFTQNEIDFCRIVANSSYYAIKNAHLYEEIKEEREELKEIAITDQLTGLKNQYYFYERLSDEFDRAVRYETEFSVLMIDIDDFKRVNDNYGHRAGDRVLKQVAAMIKKRVRKIDVVARYGGEEFGVILPHTPIAGATEEAERIRKSVGEHSYAGLVKETITISIGVATYPFNTGIMASGDLVTKADKALYAAKAGGKDCVKTAPKKAD